MKDIYEGFNIIGKIESIAVSGTVEIGLINCRGLAAIAITGQILFNASATGSVTLNFYYSPDGKNFDTIAFDTKTLTVSAGNTVQATKIVAVPDSGWIKVKATNADGTYAATLLKVWAVIVSQFIDDRKTLPTT